MSKTASDGRSLEDRPAPTYSLNRDAWAALWARTGVLTDYARAEAMGIDQGAITRIVKSTGWKARKVNLDFASRAVVALRRLTGDEHIGLDDLIQIGGE